MSRPLLIFACLLTLLAGCERRQEAPQATEPAAVMPIAVETPVPPAPPVVPLLAAPVEATVVEYATQALPAWRRCRGAEPALVLFAGEPLLQPVPDALKAETQRLLGSAADEAILERVAIDRPAPLLLPSMAIDAALGFELFSEVVWVLPTTATVDDLQLEVFRKQLLEFGAVSKEEAESFSLESGVFAGTVRGVPFRAVHPYALPAIERPIALHIDLTFFPPLYKGEIKTPLYPLLYDTLRQLRAADWRACSVTLSLGNVTGETSLDSRFIGGDLATLIGAPEKLDEPLPLFWGQRSNALYLPNFFQNEKVLELYRQMETSAPEDATVKFGLYRTLRDEKEGATALDTLAQAVALDPAYAYEYLALAQLAKEKGRPDQVLRMLQLAAAALPDNPFVAMELAAFLIDMRHGDEARAILQPLTELPWSPVYYPEMAAQLEAMLQAAAEAKREPTP